MHAIITINFRLALVATIIGCMAFYWITQSGYPESVDHLLVRSYRLKALAIPLIIVVLTVLLWFMFYKNNEGHLPAFIIGWFLFAPALSSRISENINGPFFSDVQEILCWYVGLSHIIYGLLNAREVFEGLGKDAN